VTAIGQGGLKAPLSWSFSRFGHVSIIVLRGEPMVGFFVIFRRICNFAIDRKLMKN
jgi:hypothetical protein